MQRYLYSTIYKLIRQLVCYHRKRQILFTTARRIKTEKERQFTVERVPAFERAET